MNLTAHFTLAELTASDTAERLGIVNRPDDEALDNLHTLAAGLERVRAVLGVPVVITSAYRCGKLNSAIKSKPTSAHVKGLAADFRAPGFGTVAEVAQHLASYAESIGFDQLILEGTGPGAWIHVAFKPPGELPRMQLLTARFVNGVAQYSTGIA